MSDLIHHILIRPLEAAEPVPYGLLLLADPSEEQIDRYLPGSEVYVAAWKEQVLGVLVLSELSAHVVEIKNIAVEEAYHGKGIGTLMIREALAIARRRHYQIITIATADSSTGQLYLYQKEGFEITNIKPGFFTEQYSQPIYENGLRAKDQVILSKRL